MTKFALEIQQLNKTYRNGVRALNDINLNVQDGDLFAFLERAAKEGNEEEEDCGWGSLTPGFCHHLGISIS